MLFELSIVKKYLIPRKKQLSISLIGMMSIAVISLVVWLVLVFLSVTEGIERNWLAKLTSLNAPIQIQPTSAYYSSYYYLIDQISSASNYTFKSIREKMEAPQTDPYAEDSDRGYPPAWPKKVTHEDGNIKDLVKEVFLNVEQLKKSHPDLSANDFEVTGALMRLNVMRFDHTHEVLTQASYISSFSEIPAPQHTLLIPPSVEDLNHVLKLAALSPKHSESFRAIFTHINVKSLIAKEGWSMPPSLLPQEESFQAFASIKQGKISHIFLANHPFDTSLTQGVLRSHEGVVEFIAGSTRYEVSQTPLILKEDLILNATLIPSSLDTARDLADIYFDVKGTLQGKELSGKVAAQGVDIHEGKAIGHFVEPPTLSPPWSYSLGEGMAKQYILPSNALHEAGVILPKHFQSSGVKLGDRGSLLYRAMTASAFQEQDLSFYVAGFYDPGVMVVGAKCILAPSFLVHQINLANESFDISFKNGIQVWFKDLKDTDRIKKDLQEKLREAHLDPYWSVTSFKEYEFAKDLFLQFQSDKLLFTLVGMIILMVACSNIISMLILLVNDKKKEIGILRAMGASSTSIAAIFAFTGMCLGIASTLIGTGAAIFTVRHINGIAKMLSFLQGREAFNASFYGTSLPNTLSGDALLFILIATPVISLLAGLVPALKACALKPSAILRSE